MESTRCNRCGAARDTEDNYCRACGHQLTVTLPALSSKAALPVRAHSIPPSLVGSVAVLALGTGLEWMVRRIANSAVRGAGRALVGAGGLPSRQVKGAPAVKDVSVDELLYVRKIQLRR